MSGSELVLSKFRDGTVRRFLWTAAVAFWLGGFTFYSAVAVHIGIRVLGSHLKQGFVTQQVTNWLNISGVIALALMLWNLTAIWPHRGKILRFLLLWTWVGMALVQIELLVMHPYMDRLLDTRAKEILDYQRFVWLHRVYLSSSTVQWMAGVLHVWCAVDGAKT